MELSGLGLRSLFANFSKTAGRQIWAAALNLATAAIIGRGYGPSGTGLYTVALLLPAMLAATLGLGMAPANAYYIGSNRFGLRGVIRTTLVLWGLISAIGLLSGSVIVFFRGDVYFPGIPPHALWLALLCFPFLLLISFAGSVFQGLQDFSAFNISLSLQPAVALGLIVLCVVAGAPAEALIFAYMAGTLVASSAMALMLRRRWRATVERSEETYPIRVALAFGLKSGLGNVVAFLNYRLNILLVNFFLNPAAAGIQAIAVQLGEKIWLLSQAVCTVLLPRLSEVSQDRRQAVAITMLVSRVTLAATAACAVCLAIVGHILITMAFGKSFEGAYVPLLLLLPGLTVVSSVRILSSEISSRGKPEVNLYMALAVAVVNLVLALMLIPIYGIAGAATATSIAYMTNLAIRVVYFCRHAEVRARDVLIIKASDVLAVRRAISRSSVWRR